MRPGCLRSSSRNRSRPLARARARGDLPPVGRERRRRWAMPTLVVNGRSSRASVARNASSATRSRFWYASASRDSTIPLVRAITSSVPMDPDASTANSRLTPEVRVSTFSRRSSGSTRTGRPGPPPRDSWQGAAARRVASTATARTRPRGSRARTYRPVSGASRFLTRRPRDRRSRTSRFTSRPRTPYRPAGANTCSSRTTRSPAFFSGLRCRLFFYGREPDGPVGPLGCDGSRWPPPPGTGSAPPGGSSSSGGGTPRPRPRPRRRR